MEPFWQSYSRYYQILYQNQAFNEDNSSNTLELEVGSTEEIKLMFEDITYSKGLHF